MQCPICGARLYQKEICKYCKITKETIVNASNKKVVEYRKTGRGDQVHMSGVLPKDVNRALLIFYTILLGLFGVNSFYVHRNARGTFCVVAMVSSIIFAILKASLTITVGWMAFVFQCFFELAFYLVVVNILFWATDILSVIFGTYKVPVVLHLQERDAKRLYKDSYEDYTTGDEVDG